MRPEQSTITSVLSRVQCVRVLGGWVGEEGEKGGGGSEQHSAITEPSLVFHMHPACRLHLFSHSYHIFQRYRFLLQCVCMLMCWCAVCVRLCISSECISERHFFVSLFAVPTYRHFIFIFIFIFFSFQFHLFYCLHIQ